MNLVQKNIKYILLRMLLTKTHNRGRTSNRNHEKCPRPGEKPMLHV